MLSDLSGAWGSGLRWPAGALGRVAQALRAVCTGGSGWVPGNGPSLGALLSRPQEFSAEPSCSGASLPSVCIQLRCDLSSGVAALSLPGCEADASQAHSEMSVGLMSTCPDGQEKQESADIFLNLCLFVLFYFCFIVIFFQFFCY